VGVVLISRHPEWHDAQLKSLVHAGFHVTLIGLAPSAGPHLTPWRSRKEWDSLVRSTIGGDGISIDPHHRTEELDHFWRRADLMPNLNITVPCYWLATDSLKEMSWGLDRQI
jgi:hypothetical protein